MSERDETANAGEPEGATAGLQPDAPGTASESEPKEPDRPSESERPARKASDAGQPPPTGWFAAGLVVIAAATAMTLALQPRFAGTRVPWLVMGVAYLGLAGWALYGFRRRGVLLERFRVRPGDTSIGIVLGLGLSAGGYLAQQTLAPMGSSGRQWLLRIYDFASDYQTNGALIVTLFALCALEEIVWRGMVQDQLLAARPRLAPVATAACYALSTTPSLFLLSSASGGPNPLLVLGACGSGIVLSYARQMLPRLFPLMIAHLVFAYFMAAPLPHWL